MRMDILYIHILQIIIKCDWTLNEAIHEIFVRHLKCIKMYIDLESILITMYIFLVSTEIIEYIVVLLCKDHQVFEMSSNITG